MSRQPWPEVIAVCVVAIATCVSIAGWPDLSGSKSEAWAAWIQAIGAISAIVATYFAGLRQGRQEWSRVLRLERRQEAQRLKAFAAVVDVARRNGEFISDHAERGSPRVILAGLWHLVTKAEVDATLRALDSIPLHELGKPSLIIHAVGISRQMHSIRSRVEMILTDEVMVRDSIRYDRALDAIKSDGQFLKFHWREFTKALPSGSHLEN